MAKGRKAAKQVSVTVNQIEGENRTHQVVNVARVPKTGANGAWELSNKGNLLYDVICFPVSMSVEVVRPKRPAADDVDKFKVILNGETLEVSAARKKAIGEGYVKTLAGQHVMVYKYDTDGSLLDAIDPELKKEIIRANQRKAAIRKGNASCTILASLAKMQGLANVFSQEEKVSYYNSIANLLNEVKVNLFKIAKETGKKEKPVYINL